MKKTIESRVVSVISKTLMILEEDIRSRYNLNLDEDPLDMAAVILAMEEEFNVEISDEEAGNLKCPEDFVTYLKNRS